MSACLEHVYRAILYDPAHLLVFLLHIPAAHLVLCASHKQDRGAQILQRPAKQRYPVLGTFCERLGIQIHDSFPVFALTPFVELSGMKVLFGKSSFSQQIFRKFLM